MSNSLDLENINHNIPYIISDVETTGLSCVYDAIIEIAIYKLYKQEINLIYHSYIKPIKINTQKYGYHIHKIEYETLKKSPYFYQISHLIHDIYQNNKYLVFHNAKFDLSFIQAEMRKLCLNCIENTHTIIDTMNLSKIIFNNIYKLQELVKIYNISLTTQKWHSAKFDAEMLSKVFYNMINDINKTYKKVL